MPSYDVNIPGSGKYRVNSPTDLTDDQVWLALQEQLSAPAPKPKEGVGAAFTGGLKRYGSELETALESIINPQLAAERGLAREEKLSEQYAPGASLERVKKAYEEKGLFPAAGEALSQIPAALAEQAPNIATAMGGARLGAMAGSAAGPMGALVGGGIGAAAAAFPQLYASNLQRQAQEGQPVEAGSAALAAIPGAAAEVVSEYIPLGRGLIGKILGPTAEKALAKGTDEAIERAAKESVMGSITKGAGLGVLAEVPTEVAQQMLERYQAGLPLTTQDALAEYGEAAYGAGIVGAPFGAIGRTAGRPVARAEFEALQQQRALEAAPPEVAPENITELPKGFSVERQEIGRAMVPQTFNITMPGSETPLASYDTEDEANEKLPRLQQIRQDELATVSREIEDLKDSLQKKYDRLDYLEATGQTQTQEYQSLRENIPNLRNETDDKIGELFKRQEEYQQPLQVQPFGEREQVNEQFVLRDKAGKEIGAFPSMEAATAALREQVGEKAFAQAQERAEQMKELHKQLVPALQKFGLKDVGLKILDDMEHAGGSYSNKLIQVAMTEGNPLKTLRHEAVHALKDMGFFTPQQWRALEERAKKEWIKTHLEGQQTEIDGQPMSRLEGYKKMGLSEQDIIEEAIADAFAAYDKGEVPPPGLIASLYKKLKNFFANFGQALRGAGFESADDIFQKIERGELKPSLKAPVSATTGEIKYSQAPEGIPQKLWDLHQKSMAADEAASGYNVGPIKANATKANRRLLKAVAEHVGDDEQAQIALMVKMNEESNRRGEGWYGTTRFSLKKPGSDIGHKREATSGRYVGAPDWVGSSPQQLTVLRKKLKALAKEGEPGRFWYENSSKAILELAGGDKKEAEKIVGLIAIYSPNATVPANTSMALNAYYQYKTGQPINAGFSEADKKAEDLLRHNKEWSGIKTNSFYQNLMVEIDPSKLDPGVATMDMWMALAFDYGMKALDQGPKYKFAEREIQNLAKELGWDAHQVQAAIWTAMKGRIDPIRGELKKKELESGIGEMYEKDGKMLYRVKPERRYDHFRLAHKLGMEYNLTPEDIVESKFDFSDAINDRTAQMSWEATPGESTGVLPGIIKAPVHQKFEYLDEVSKELLNSDGNDKIAIKIGLPVGKTIAGFSAWKGDIGAGKQTFTGVAMQGQKDKRDVTPEARNLLNLYCAIKGYVLNQEAVVWHVPTYDGSIKNQNGIEARFNRGLNHDEMQQLYQALYDKFGTWEVAPGYLSDGTRMLNFVESSGDNGQKSIPQVGFKGKINLVIRDGDWNETPVKDFSVKDGVLTTDQKVPADSRLVAKLDNKSFQKGVQEALESLPSNFGDGMMSFTAYKSVGDYIFNDWTEAKQGEKYAEQIESLAAQVGITNPSGLLDWASNLRTDVEAINKRFSKKYDWGRPSTRPEQAAIRPSAGGREGITLGNKRQENAITVTGVHYGKVKTDELDAKKYGSGLRGGERRRLEDAFDPRIKNRVYFYIKKDDGTMPLRESGVGTHAYTQTFNNILGKGPEMSRLFTEAQGDSNEFETKIIDAGYDGYAIPNMGMMVILNHNVPAEYRGTVAELEGKHPEAKYSLKTSFPTATEAEAAAYQKAPPETTQFKQWFGASKIIEEGRPQVMYHASPEDFDVFREKKPIFVSPSPTEAEYFGKRHRTTKKMDVNVYPLWVRAETPFDYENKDHVTLIRQSLIDNPLIGEEFATSEERLSSGDWSAIEDPAVLDAIKKLGFDSFYVSEGKEKNLAVFGGNQVKSVTGNTGDFSRETKDIRYSLKSAVNSFDPAEVEKHSETKYKGREKLINMKISDFLSLAEEGFVKEKQEIADKRVRDGVKFTSLPYMAAHGDGDTLVVDAHEGRHRARALQKAGYETMPVRFVTGIRYSEQLDPDKFDYVETWPSKLQAEKGSADPSFTVQFPFTREEGAENYKQPKYSLPSISQGAIDAINRVTSVREQKGFMERILDAVSPKNYAYYRQQALNRYEALSMADKAVAKKLGITALTADQSAEMAALMSDLHSGVAASVFGIQGRRGGVPVLRNGITTVDHSRKGLVAVLAPLAKYGDAKVFQYFQFYSAVKRGHRLFAEGRERLITPADQQHANELLQKFPEFEAVRKDWVTFNDAITDYLKETGVLSAADAAKFKQYADYIPFYRQLEGDDTLGPNIFQSLSGVKKPKKLEGGTAPLADFMETIVRNTHAAITAGMKNQAEMMAVKVGKQAGVVHDIAPGAHVGEFEKIKVLINGVKHEYQATDPLFVDATRSLHMPDLPFMSFLSAPANLLRNVVTREPGFIMTNLLRDSVSAYVTSGQNITPIAGTVINFAKAMKGQSPEFEALMDAGIIGGYEFSANIEQSGAKLTADLMKKAGKGPALLKPFTSLWDGLEHATTASDAATRMAVYERVMAETGNEAEALARALEVMNFNRKGSSGVVRILTAAVPFLNARMQGLDLFYRAMTGKMNMTDAKEIQRKFYTRGMMILGLSTMYYFAVAGNPDYEKQEQETKDNNWIVPGAGIRIPIPFEVGILFKTIPERIAAYTFGNDTGKDFLEAMNRAANGFIPISPSAYIPQTFKPIIEAMTNYNFFTQREIVGMGLKDVDPKYQVGPGTSAFAEFVGKTLGLSPLKVDHVFKGYTGSMGMYAVDLMDSVMELNGDSPKPTKRFEQMPIIKRFALDPEARGNVTNYYQLKDSVDTAVRTMNLLEKSGDPQEFAKYVQENAGLLAFKSYVSDLEKSMKELRDMRKQVLNSGMTGDQKRDINLAIGQAENNLSANIQTVKKVIDKL